MGTLITQTGKNTTWLVNIAMENIYNSPFIDGLPNKNGDFSWQTVKLPEGSSLQKTWQSTVGHILVTDHIKSRNKTLDHPMNMWVCLEIALFKRCFPYVNGLV